MSAIFFAAGLASFEIDIGVSQFALADSGKNIPGELSRLLGVAETFGEKYGLIAVFCVIAVLDRAKRRFIPRLVAIAFATGFLNLFLKLSIGRGRPRYFDGTESSLPSSVWDTFTGWFPFLEYGIDSNFQSFTSGHTTSAVGLAIGLAWLYPRGAWLFASFASLAALERIECGAHYASDVLMAAALTTLIAGMCLDKRALGRYFSRWEAKRAVASTDKHG